MTEGVNIGVNEVIFGTRLGEDVQRKVFISGYVMMTSS